MEGDGRADIDRFEAQPNAARLSWYRGLVNWVERLKREVLALYYAVQHPRVGFMPRALALAAVGYALSPLDLIPDFIPVLGVLDDLILLPGLIWLAIRLIPPEVMQEARLKAEIEPLTLSKNWVAATCIFAAWDALLLLCVAWGFRRWGSAFWVNHWWIAVTILGVLLTVGQGIWLASKLRAEQRVR